MRIIVALLLSIFTAACLAGGQMNGTVEIYYVPIGVETYVPVTEENITESYVRYAEITAADQDVRLLLSTLNDTEDGTFDGQIVRAKIVLPDGALVYVDNEGGVKISGRTAKLSTSNLSRVEKLFEEITERR